MPRRTDTRSRILAEALKLFARHGAEAASMRDIAAAVGVSEAALYRHFASKEALTHELFVTHYQALGREMQKRSARATTLRGKLTAMVRTCCELYDANEPAFRFLLLTQHHEAPLVPKDDDNPARIVRHAIADGIARREIPERDLFLLSAYFFGLLTKPAEFRIYGVSDAPMSALAADIADAIWAALSRRRS
jgi:AcrR family transcriptional regulator